MQIEHLEMFIETVQLGSFAAVAEKRQLSATSVSRSVQQLEHQLGLKLLQRSTRKLSLTEAGEVYYQQVVPILQSLTQAHQQAQDIKQTLQGKLRVTVPIGFAESRLIPLIPAFHALHPELRLELLITDECLDLQQEKIDVGVRIGQVNEINWVAKPLLQVPFIACASPAFLRQHSLKNPDDLQRVPCLGLIPHPSAKQWRFSLKKSDLANAFVDVWVNQTLLTTHEQSTKQLCLAGQGVALLPFWLVQQELATGQLLEILPDYRAAYPQSEGKIWITYPNRDYIPAKSRAFIDFLMAEFKN
ncbi:LysR family transcriptional regulator [Thiosulfatimonas sediminis]|uniref:LysR family transcriptional regulator n=1 Tax=Thiosulfatimonas sediminis TaxID=2675054 RepID=A0A6F8PYC4_9GAMM|nr:LysR family transcriptional regulator [Thiosulfatimonas sediminis]BBP47047.1 LysR family transcriptional regulator [Thiosulfatimonas sediminis]